MVVAQDVTASKAMLRRRVLEARRSMSAADRAADAASLTSFLLDLPETASARCVAAYYSFGTEPSTTTALSTLKADGVRVLLPVLRPDLDLDWAIYDPRREPPQDHTGASASSGERLGVAAVSTVDLLVVPALAVARDGTRLGRGGGSYDRALSRVPATTPVVALLYAGELLDRVPREDHDRAVTVAVQPDGVHRLPLAVPS